MHGWDKAVKQRLSPGGNGYRGKHENSEKIANGAAFEEERDRAINSSSEKVIWVLF